MANVQINLTVHVDGEKHTIDAFLTEEPPHGQFRRPKLVWRGRAYGAAETLVPGLRASQFVARWDGWQDNSMAHRYVGMGQARPLV